MAEGARMDGYRSWNTNTTRLKDSSIQWLQIFVFGVVGIDHLWPSYKSPGCVYKYRIDKEWVEEDDVVIVARLFQTDTENVEH